MPAVLLKLPMAAVVWDLVWHCCDLLARLPGKNTPGAPSLATTSQWRHNGWDCVSNHQPHNCLLNRLFRCRSKKTSKLRVTGRCEGNSPATGEFPAQRAVTWKVFPFNGDVIMSFSPWSTSIQWLPHGPSYQGTNKHSLVAKWWQVAVTGGSITVTNVTSHVFYGM